MSVLADRWPEIKVTLVDLNEDKIVYGNSEIKFQVDAFKKKCLLEGLDDIALSLKKSEKIEKFEKDLKDSFTPIFEQKEHKKTTIKARKLVREMSLRAKWLSNFKD